MIEWITYVFPPNYTPTLFKYIEPITFFLYFILFRFIIKNYIQKFELYQYERRVVILSWNIRIFLGIGIYYFYDLYYGGGDIVNYVNDAKNLFTAFFQEPILTLSYIAKSILHLDSKNFFIENPEFYLFWSKMKLRLSYIYDINSQVVSMFIFIFIFLGLGSYMAAEVLFSTLFTIVMLRTYVRYKKRVSISPKTGVLTFFMLPSVLLWTSAPFKESIALLCITSMLGIGLSDKLRLSHLLEVTPYIVLGYLVKPYLIILLTPFIVLMIYSSLLSNIKSNNTRFLSNIIVYPVILVFGIYLLYLLAEYSGKYSTSNIVHQAYLVYTDLSRNESYYTETGGSIYDIGLVEPTLPSMLSKFPIATFTGIFRPLIFDAKKPIIIIPSIENTVLFIFFVIYVLKYRPIPLIKTIISSTYLRYLFLYSVLLLFMIGLTSGNFGNLIRYKTPAAFIFWLVIFSAVDKLRHENRHRWRR